MYILNIASAIKKTVNELKSIVFVKENSYRSMKYQKKKYLQLFATKLTGKMPNPSHPKEYNSYLKRKKHD